MRRRVSGPRPETPSLLGEVCVEVDSRGQYVFLVGKATKISRALSAPAKLSDLKAGQRVSVRYNAIIAPVCPPEAFADSIVIEADPLPRKKT
jgi:hypothetical protein